jgi:hypothetical protein
MSRIGPSILASIALLAVTGAPGLALADELPLSGAELKLAPALAADAAPQTMSQDDLAKMSGGADVTVNETTALSNQELNAVSNNNTVGGNLTTGQVTFAPGSLSDFAGIGHFVVNTGANNILQGTISVSIATSSPTP